MTLTRIEERRRRIWAARGGSLQEYLKNRMRPIGYVNTKAGSTMFERKWFRVVELSQKLLLNCGWQFCFFRRKCFDLSNTIARTVHLERRSLEIHLDADSTSASPVFRKLASRVALSPHPRKTPSANFPNDAAPQRRRRS